MKFKEWLEEGFLTVLGKVLDALFPNRPEPWEDTYLVNECVRYPYYTDGIPPEYALLTCYPDPVWDGDSEFPRHMWEVLEPVFAGKRTVFRFSSWEASDVEAWKTRLPDTAEVRDGAVYMTSVGLPPSLRETVMEGVRDLWLLLDVRDEEEDIIAKFFLDTAFGEHWGVQFAFRDADLRERTKETLRDVCRKYGRKPIETDER